MKYIKEYKKTLLVLLLVLFVVGYYTYQTLSKNYNEQTSVAGQLLQNTDEKISYTNLAGEVLNLDSHISNVLVVNSWASWSPDSAHELPMLAKVADEFKNEKIKIIAINRGEPVTTAERFLTTIGVSEDVELVLDKEDRFYQSIGGYAMPETVIYDQSGNVIYHHRGVITEDIVMQYLEQILNQ